MRQLFYLFIAVMFLGLAACTSAPKKEGEADADATEVPTEEVAAINTLTEQEKNEGWVLMFDGETTKGWRGYGLDAFPSQGWSIEDGAIKCSNSGKGEAGFGGDIIFDKQFTNFKFKVDWMIEEGGNSGIFLLGQESDEHKIWYTAPEYQILDNDGPHIDNELGENGNRRAGSLYDMIPSDTALFKGAMEWHSAEIISYEGTIAFKLDGVTTMEFHLWTDEWKALVAKSKFPGINRDFANVAKTGYIGLQDHGHAVWFRNLKIKEL
ncbi:MAG: DUF1080 domain-containing protein [Bacteroidales bacterium]|nr:DUF1080 domain-containing protein [Bacteroidales bacterium]